MFFAPFAVFYTKVPNHTSDLIDFLKSSSQSANIMDSRIIETLQKVQDNLEAANSNYKERDDIKKSLHVFKERDLVMVHLRKHLFQLGNIINYRLRNLALLEFRNVSMTMLMSLNSHLIRKFNLLSMWLTSISFILLTMFLLLPAISRTIFFQVGRNDAEAICLMFLLFLFNITLSF